MFVESLKHNTNRLSYLDINSQDGQISFNLPSEKPVSATFDDTFSSLAEKVGGDVHFRDPEGN